MASSRRRDDRRFHPRSTSVDAVESRTAWRRAGDSFSALPDTTSDAGMADACAPPSQVDDWVIEHAAAQHDVVPLPGASATTVGVSRQVSAPDGVDPGEGEWSADAAAQSPSHALAAEGLVPDAGLQPRVMGTVGRRVIEPKSIPDVARECTYPQYESVYTHGAVNTNRIAGALDASRIGEGNSARYQTPRGVLAAAEVRDLREQLLRKTTELEDYVVHSEKLSKQVSELNDKYDTLVELLTSGSDVQPARDPNAIKRESTESVRSRTAPNPNGTTYREFPEDKLRPSYQAGGGPYWDNYMALIRARVVGIPATSDSDEGSRSVEGSQSTRLKPQPPDTYNGCEDDESFWTFVIDSLHLNYKDKCRTKYRTCIQDGRDLRDYMHELEHFWVVLTEATDRLRVLKFWEGLDSWLVQRLMEDGFSKEIDELEPTYRRALELWKADYAASTHGVMLDSENDHDGLPESHEDEPEENPPSSEYSEDEERSTASEGEDTDAASLDDYGKSPELLERLRQEGRCFNCESKGHISRDCPDTEDVPPESTAQPELMIGSVSVETTCQIHPRHTEGHAGMRATFATDQSTRCDVGVQSRSVSAEREPHGLSGSREDACSRRESAGRDGTDGTR
ncbi:hypothetical protein GGF50DRAFT_87893 [Schizophyllum commune]